MAAFISLLADLDLGSLNSNTLVCLDSYLQMRSFMVGYTCSSVDVHMHAVMKGEALFVTPF
jgi:hypothetical protein